MGFLPSDDRDAVDFVLEQNEEAAVPVWRLHVPVEAMSAGIFAGDADNFF